MTIAIKCMGLYGDCGCELRLDDGYQNEATYQCYHADKQDLEIVFEGHFACQRCMERACGAATKAVW